MAREEFIVHTPREIEGIRRAAAAAAYVREKVAELVRPGMSTRQVDEMADSLIQAQGGKPAFLGYHGYPGFICISVNDEVVHGIGRPDRILMNGDIISLDIGVDLDGCIGDTAKTVIVGSNPSPDVARLLEFTEKSLLAGIAEAKVGNHVMHISRAVEKVAKSAKLGIVREYVGHGCGTRLHEPPEVPNYASFSKGPKLVPGMILAIEPMLNLGSHKVYTEPDKWTVRTYDGSLSAHFEHMVLITEKEPEILTCLKK